MIALVVEELCVIREDLGGVENIVGVLTVLELVEVELFALGVDDAVFVGQFFALVILEVIDFDKVIAWHLLTLTRLIDVSLLKVEDLANVCQCTLEFSVILLVHVIVESKCSSL